MSYKEEKLFNLQKEQIACFIHLLDLVIELLILP